MSIHLSEAEQQAIVNQEMVFTTACAIMEERTPAYGLVWQQYGALANLLNAARKIDRLMNVWWFAEGEQAALHKDSLDDAYDALNYLGFFVQCARSGNLLGTAPTRPEEMGTLHLVAHDGTVVRTIIQDPKLDAED